MASRTSCIAFCGEFRDRSLLVVHSPSLPRLLRLGLGWSDRGGDRSCHAPPFRTARAGPFRFSLSFALSFFGPSLGTPFRSCVPQTLLWPLLTPRRLSTSGSPRVRVCSFRSRLWALQKAVSDCRASRVLACSPPDSCLTAHLCSFGRTFACRPFAPPPCGDDLAVRLRLASLPPSGTFHPDRPDPCRAHERRFPTGFGREPLQ